MHSLPITSMPPTALPSHWEPRFCSLLNSSCNFFPAPSFPPTSCSCFRAFVPFRSSVCNALGISAPSHPLSQIKCRFLRELCSFYLTRCSPAAPISFILPVFIHFLLITSPPAPAQDCKSHEGRDFALFTVELPAATPVPGT